ncbi:hypothetical protein [Agrococcus beijingensis]|uniref:hypothetical protein n=1 Tax=Agrococcus beijingensis TaxID=3068634 RepID=UPI002741675B|nr:hypothetical protein [Agrococcus sp. REN33]
MMTMAGAAGMTGVTGAATATATAAMQEELRRRARAARSAVRRASYALDDATALVRLEGLDGWLGPARDAYDARVEALRGRLLREQHELRVLEHSLTGLL